MAERMPIVDGNWKMNMDLASGVELAEDIAAGCGELIDRCEVAVFPAFPYLQAVGNALGHHSLLLGAQDVYHEPGYVPESALAQGRSGAYGGHARAGKTGCPEPADRSMCRRFCFVVADSELDVPSLARVRGVDNVRNYVRLFSFFFAEPP